MLADAGVKLRGDEDIRVRGVVLAQKREIERQRKLELLRITMNPVDTQITGLEGRAEILRDVVEDAGMDAAKIVPDPEALKAAAGPAAAPGQIPPGMQQPAKPGQPGPGPNAGTQIGAAGGPPGAGGLNTVQSGPTAPGAPISMAG